MTHSKTPESSVNAPSLDPHAALGQQTRLLHDRKRPIEAVRTVNPAVQRGSTILMADSDALYDHDLLTYGRAGLPIHQSLMGALSDLEGAIGTRLFPSGLAAITGALLAVLRAGDGVLVPDCAYAPTRRFCDTVLKRLGMEIVYFPPTASAEEIMALATDRTRVVLIESPGSLTFEMQDAPAIAAIAKARGIISMMDNTWGAGLLFKPLAYGIDISIQALTKYVGGHSDVFMGSASTRDPALLQLLDDAVWQVGWATSSEDAYQMLRGLRTLSVRLERHGKSTLDIAHWLREQPQVSEVLCPALPGARGHEIWARDYDGLCGLFSFILTPGPKVAVDALINSLQLFGLGFSWGGYESLAIPCDPQLVRTAADPKLQGPLIRLHIGLEDVADLKADLANGLAAYSAACV